MTEKVKDVKSKEPALKELELPEQLERVKKALEDERRRAEDYLNRLKYLQADFENYRKRVQREVSELIQVGNERLITNLLGIVDELELAIRAAKESKEKNTIVEGVEIVLKKLNDILKGEGVSMIEAVGKTFDPILHEAVENVVVEELPPGSIVEEVRRGYSLRGKVIRPSIVKVALAPSNIKDESKKEGEER